MVSPSTAIYKQPMVSAAYALGKLCAIRPKTAPEGIAVCLNLARHQIRSTLGKFSTSRDRPEKIVEEYCLASRAVSAAGVGASRFYLSLKPPALEFDAERAWDIAATALAHEHGVHFDSHGHDVALPTFDLMDNLITRSNRSSDTGRDGQFSITLPSRWKRSIVDAEWAIDRGTRVRLVKGEFKASNALEETDPREGLLALVEILAGRAPALAIATHDVGLAREAIARSRNSGSSIELELLYLFPAGQMSALARETGTPIRFYVPYGDLLFVYAVRHLLTNPRKWKRGNCLRSWLSRSTPDLQRFDFPEDRPVGST